MQLMARRLASQSLSRTAATARVVPNFARSFRVSVPALTSFEDSRIGRPHCHHQSLWKVWKPLASNGSLQSGDGDWAGGIVGLERNYEVVEDLTKECEYLLEVLKTMDASVYKSAVMAKTEFKLKVLRSGKSEEEMKEEIGFGELEEVHAVVRGELDLIKKLGKAWFSSPAPALPPYGPDVSF